MTATERKFFASRALNKRITDMEQTLGSELFAGNPRGIWPTLLGEQVIPYVRNVMRNLAQLAEFAGRSGRTIGYVRICTPIAATVGLHDSVPAEWGRQTWVGG